MQISTLITSLRKALGGFACLSGQAGVKNTLKMALSTFLPATHCICILSSTEALVSTVTC